MKEVEKANILRLISYIRYSIECLRESLFALDREKVAIRVLKMKHRTSIPAVFIIITIFDPTGLPSSTIFCEISNKIYGERACRMIRKIRPYLDILSPAMTKQKQGTSHINAMIAWMMRIKGSWILSPYRMIVFKGDLSARFNGMAIQTQAKNPKILCRKKNPMMRSRLSMGIFWRVWACCAIIRMSLDRCGLLVCFLCVFPIEIPLFI